MLLRNAVVYAPQDGEERREDTQKREEQRLCGPKTLILRDDDFELRGENEDTVYQYDAVQRTASDDKHYFIFVDEFSAIIVPFEAFGSMDEQRSFYERITKNITDPALKC